MTAKENLIRTIKHDNPQWVPYRYDGTLRILASKIVNVRPIMGGKDDWGVAWLFTNKEEGSYPGGDPVLDIENVDSFSSPRTDWAAVTDDMKNQIKALEGLDVLPIAYTEYAIFDRVQFLLGYEGLMFALVENREKLDQLIEKVYQYHYKFVEALLDADVEGIRFTDDWGMQDRLFISPADWRFFFKERYRALYNLVKTRGKLVFHHSCGCIESIINDIIELGVDVLDPLQPAANDMFKLKENYGSKICFMGGLDTQSWLSFGTEDEVYNNTLKILKVMSKGGGYIAAPSHTITIPQANRNIMAKAIQDHNYNINHPL
jgi:uroporphyrinogen decarboxylase